jgi:hypothetical protein
MLVGVDCAPCAPGTPERFGWLMHRMGAPVHICDELRHQCGWLAREIYVSRGGPA